jgi:hypothetical protein
MWLALGNTNVLSLQFVVLLILPLAEGHQVGNLHVLSLELDPKPLINS